MSAEPSIDITVCILSYNRPKFLPEAVGSVLAQTSKPRDIIILDNGSRPEVKESVEEFLRRGVIWCGAEETHPASWNFYRALRAGNGSLVYVMHDDDRLKDNFLETQGRLLQESSLAVAIGCNVIRIDANGSENGPNFPDEASAGGVLLLRDDVDVAERFSMGKGMHFPTMIYRRSLILKVTTREEEFGKYADVVFLCDMATVGPVLYNRVPLMDYRIHSGQDSHVIDDPLFVRLEEELLRRSENGSRYREAKQSVSSMRVARRFNSVLSKLIEGRFIEAFVIFGRTFASGEINPFATLDYVRIVAWRIIHNMS